MSGTDKNFSITAERDYRRARIEITMSNATADDIKYLVNIVKDFQPYWHDDKPKTTTTNSGNLTVSYASSDEEGTHNDNHK